MGTIYSGKSRFNRQVVGRVAEDGTVHRGKVRFSMEVVGRVAQDGTVYRAQSKEMAALWKRLGYPAELVVPDRLDHFDVANQLRDPGCELVKMQLDQMRLAFGG